MKNNILKGGPISVGARRRRVKKGFEGTVLSVLSGFPRSARWGDLRKKKKKKKKKEARGNSEQKKEKKMVVD